MYKDKKKEIGDTYLEDISRMIMTLMKIKLNFDIWKRLCFNLILFLFCRYYVPVPTKPRGTAAKTVPLLTETHHTVL